MRLTLCCTTWIELKYQIIGYIFCNQITHRPANFTAAIFSSNSALHATLTYNCPLGGRRDPPRPPSRAGTGQVASWWKPDTPAPSEGSCRRLPPRWGWRARQWVGGEGPPSCPAGLEEWGGSFWPELQAVMPGRVRRCDFTCCCPFLARASSRLAFSESFCSFGEGLGCCFWTLWKRRIGKVKDSRKMSYFLFLFGFKARYYIKLYLLCLLSHNLPPLTCPEIIKSIFLFYLFCLLHLFQVSHNMLSQVSLFEMTCFSNTVSDHFAGRPNMLFSGILSSFLLDD